MNCSAARTAKFRNRSLVARWVLAAAATSMVAIGCGDAAVGSTTFHPGGGKAGHKTGATTGGAPTAGSGAGDTNSDTPGAGDMPSTPAGDPPGTGPRHGADAGGPVTGGGSFDVNVASPTLTGDLLDEKSTIITIAPSGTFTGPVQLALQGAGPELTAAFDGGQQTAA